MGRVKPPGAIRVVLVDDDPLVVTGLELILGADDDISVVGHAGDGETALRVVADTDPDVVLMDMRMPVRDGLSATELLSARPGAPRIIALTTFDQDELVVRALRAGASGFLLKDTPPDRLIDAVHAAAAGEPVLSPRAAAHVIEAATGGATGRGRETRDEARRRLAQLTDREREVVVEVGRGRSNAEIAVALFMSIATVKAHVGHALTRTGADNRVQLALLAHDAGE